MRVVGDPFHGSWFEFDRALVYSFVDSIPSLEEQ